MNTAQFIIPPNSPLQRGLRPKTPGVVLTVSVILSAHILLFGSFLVRGWIRSSAENAAGPAALTASAAQIGPSESSAQGAEPSAAPAAPVTLMAQSTPPLRPGAPAPEASPVESALDASFYVAKSGDTLTRIAKLHGTTVNALRQANELRSDRLALGQKIRLP
jgi:nucleoid-associated protein YgaU